MTDQKEKRLAKLEEKENRRKEQVKQYFARRRAKEAVYKAFFIKNANEAEKAKLVNVISNI